MADVVIGLYEPLVVDVLGTDFHTVNVTKSVLDQIEAAEDEANKADASGNYDRQVDLLCRLYDLRLTPIAPARKKPSAVIREAWDANKVSVGGLLNGLEQIADAEAEAVRPT